MKFLYYLGFLAACTATVYLGVHLLKAFALMLKEKTKGLLLVNFISAITLALFFLQYCLITQTAFPFQILMILIGAMIIAFLINEFIGAVVGFTSKRKRNKVYLLTVAVAFEQALENRSKNIILIITGWLLFASWIAISWVFWANPFGDEKVYEWAAVYIFIIPQILAIISTLNNVVPIITSEYADDDLRNSILSSNFSQILVNAVYLIFPFTILSIAYPDNGSWLPHFWILTLAPVALFILLGVIPFFMGMHKYKNQSKEFLEWILKWLEEFKNSLQLPTEEKKLIVIENLTKEITEQEEDNKLYSFFKDRQYDILRAKADLDPGEQTIVALQENQEDIKRWDLQLSYISELEEINDSINNIKDVNQLKTYIDGKLNVMKIKMESLDKRKNRIVGWLVTIISGILTFLIKAYEVEILNFFKDSFHS